MSRYAALVAGVCLMISLLTPAESWACATCFGDPNSEMAVGMNNGILALLGIILFVQGGFVALFLSVRRRAKRLQELRDSFCLIEGDLR